MNNINTTKIIPHRIIVVRQESGFDRACDMAYMLALSHFGIDEYGYSSTFDYEYEQSTDCVMIEFIRYRSSGSEHTYFFKTWIERNEEDE